MPPGPGGGRLSAVRGQRCDICVTASTTRAARRKVGIFQGRAEGHRRAGRGDSSHRGAKLVEHSLCDGGGKFGGHAAAGRTLVDHDCSAGALHRGGDSARVEGRQGPQIDDLGRGLVLGRQPFGGLDSQRHGRAEGDQAHVVATALHRGLPDRQPIASFGQGPAGAVQAHVIQEHDRIAVGDRLQEQALGGSRSGRSHHLQARDAGEDLVKRVGVLASGPEPGAGRHAAHIAGSSLGGAIGLHLVVHAPARVLTLQLHSSWLATRGFSAYSLGLLKKFLVTGGPTSTTRRPCRCCSVAPS